jgi:micrococcal nuclease
MQSMPINLNQRLFYRLGLILNLAALMLAALNYNLLGVSQTLKPVSRAKPVLKVKPLAQVITIERVIDGDTVVGKLADGLIVHVRMLCTDAPERGDIYWLPAKQALAELLKDKTITVIITGTDLYGRKLGSLYADGQSIQAQLATLGLTFYYSLNSSSCQDKQLIIDGDNYAADQKLNIRSQPNYAPPWKVRQTKRAPILVANDRS